MTRFRAMRLARLLSICLLAVQFAAGRASADVFTDRAEVKAEVVPAKAHPGQTVTYVMRMEIKDGFHSYPTKQPNPEAADFTTSFKPPRFGEFVPVGEVVDPPTQELHGNALQ